MAYGTFDNPLNFDLILSTAIQADDFLMIFASANPGQFSRIKARELTGGLIQTDVTLPTAGVLTMNATPIQVLAAPGAGFAHVIMGAMFFKAAGTAYAGIAAGEDLALRYTNGSGAIMLECETTGFLDQATAQVRYAYPVAAAAVAPIGDVTPVANAAVVAHMLVGEITTGNSDIKCRIWSRLIPTTL